MPVSLELWRWKPSGNFTLMELLRPVEARQHYCKVMLWKKPRVNELVEARV